MRLGQTPVGFTGHLTLHMMHDMTGAAKMYRHLSFRLIVVIEKSIAFHGSHPVSYTSVRSSA